MPRTDFRNASNAATAAIDSDGGNRVTTPVFFARERAPAPARFAVAVMLAGAASFLGVAPALAEEKVMTERSLTAQTGWWQYHNVTADQLSSYIDQHKARLVSLAVNDASPLRFSAALVANSGPHASGWWWYYGLTEAQLNARLTENKARLISIEVYEAGGQPRFAAVMVPNTGAAAIGWWWYYGKSPDQLGALAKQHDARIVDLDRYDIGGIRFAAIMVSNQGPKASGWWWYYGQTADQVSQLLKQNKARLLDLERHGSGANQRFDVVMVPNSGGDAIGWWWYHGLSAQQLLEITRRHGARLIDIQPPQDGAANYAGLMIDNGMARQGDCGGSMASVDNAVIAWMKRHQIPGGSAAVIKGDRLVYACSFGFADLAAGELVTTKDRFRLASISKPITRSAMKQLEADGKLAMNDKMLNRLGSAKPAQPYADQRLDDVTLQHLMDHKGGWNIGKLGFDPMFYSNQIASALGTPRPTSCTNVIRYMFQKVKLSFGPGGGIDDKDYSNFGYCILGRVIEARSGKSYEDYVQDAVLAPIGISQMRVGHSLSSQRFPNEVQYYSPPFTADVTPVFPSPPAPAQVQYPDGGSHIEAMDAHGGWIATAIDTARFARFANPQPYGGNWAFEGG